MVRMETGVCSKLIARLLRTRWLARADLAFRSGLGWLFAQRLLLLEHTGRVSCQPRFVVLEIVGCPARDEIIVASGFGEAA